METSNEIYVVPVKDKQSGKVTTIKTFADYDQALEFSISDEYRTNAHVRKPILGVQAESEEEAIDKAKASWLEDMNEISSREKELMRRWANEEGV